MDTIEEILRLPSPAPRPQSLAHDGSTLWMGSRETRRIYAIDPARWTARDETECPNVPWGLAAVGDDLFVIYGVGDDDDRVVKRYVPGHGFTAKGSFRAPEGTGSHLSWDGDVLYISQWYNQRILGVDGKGEVLSTIELPHGVCGQTIVQGRFYCVCTDDEENGPYWLTRVDARGASPRCEDIAIIPFPARALTFDGEHFWTNHRDADQIVAFARRDG